MLYAYYHICGLFSQRYKNNLENKTKKSFILDMPGGFRALGKLLRHRVAVRARAETG